MTQLEKKKADILDNLGTVFTGVTIGLLIGFIPAVVWLGFRSDLAVVTRTPEIKDVSFWSVYWFSVFVWWTSPFRADNLSRARKRVYRRR